MAAQSSASKLGASLISARRNLLQQPSHTTGTSTASAPDIDPTVPRGLSLETKLLARQVLHAAGLKFGKQIDWFCVLLKLTEVISLDALQGTSTRVSPDRQHRRCIHRYQGLRCGSPHHRYIRDESVPITSRWTYQDLVLRAWREPILCSE